MVAMIRLVHGPDATFHDRLRATMALFSINSALFLLKHDDSDTCGPHSGGPRVGTLEEAMAAALEVALEISGRITPTAAQA